MRTPDEKRKRAIAYGKARGWKLKSNYGSFGWYSLVGRPIKLDGWGSKIDPDPPGLDHTWFFVQGRVPAAIVTFPYNGVEPYLSHWRKFASDNGLSMDVGPEDANWYGHGTTMIIWSKANEIPQDEKRTERRQATGAGASG
jgi:hypothetical protein